MPGAREEALIREHTRTMEVYAKAAHRGYCSLIPEEDLIQEAAMVLIRLHRDGNYDGSKHTACFRTFFVACMVNRFRNLAQQSRAKMLLQGKVDPNQFTSTSVGPGHDSLLALFEAFTFHVSTLASQVLNLKLAAAPEGISHQAIARQLQEPVRRVQRAAEELKLLHKKLNGEEIIPPPPTNHEEKMPMSEAPKKNQTQFVLDLLASPAAPLTKPELVTRLQAEYPGSKGARVYGALGAAKKAGLLKRSRENKGDEYAYILTQPMTFDPKAESTTKPELPSGIIIQHASTDPPPLETFPIIPLETTNPLPPASPDICSTLQECPDIPNPY